MNESDKIKYFRINWAKNGGTVKASYVVITYVYHTVTYNGNGNTSGTVPADVTKYLYNADVDTKANSGSLAKTGFTFSGWNTKADGTGTTFAVSTSKAFTITKDTTLYAKWVAAASCDDPSAPGNSSVSGTGVTISTSSSSANYDIYYSTSSTTPTTQEPTATISSGNSKAITGLSYGTTYYYWMRQNCGGGSTSSWVVGSPTSFTTTVPAPTGVSAGSLSMTGATISITDANDVNNYDVYCSTSSAAPDGSTTPSASGTSKSIAVTGLTSGETYYYWARAKGPNAKSTWYGGSTFKTLTLSSISVSTAPTKTKYLVGDNFDPTGLVITRTYSNSTSDTYTYSGHTSEFSFSPATNAALTALNTSVTITYGGQTASQAINVYTVTVNKVNMSGTAITNASVTATCSGRTLSQSVGSTNYKFNSWNVTAGGVTVSTNTITGTPTGNVTINAKFHDPITVTWKVGSGAASGGTGEVKYGTAITALPSTPADNALASCGTNKFMGWTALGELKGTGNDAPADLFTTVGGAANLTTNTTYRAVFASSTSGAAAGTTIYSEDFSGYSADDQPNGSITNSHTGTTVYGGNTLTYSYSDGSGTTKIYAANLAGGTSPELLIAKYSGYFQIAGIPTGNADSLTITYKQNGQSLTPSISETGYSGTGLGTSSSSSGTRTIHIKVGSASAFTLKLTGPSGNNNVRLDDILITVKKAGITYADYQTGCCEAPGTALSITSANSVATGGTVSLTSTGGNGGTVTWSVVNGTGSATIEGTTLTAGTVGTVTVKAHQDANTVLGTEYCAQDAEQAFTVVSSTVNVTGVEVSPTSKAIVPGETFDITPTISPSNATDKSVSWTSSASDKASVSSGTVTGVAAGTATITCTTTDGSHTATTAVTVYAVTMLATDEDGNAIGVGGPGAPSRTGASISPAADAGNYVFKEWAISGASLGSSASTKANTITNPTGAVTVTAKYYKPRVVKWSVNGNDSYTAGGATTAVAYNGTISTVPTDPSGLACAGTFVAWTDATHNNGQTAKDDDSYYESKLFTDAGDFPNITAETTTFYAVFAEGGEAAVNTTMWSENWTGVTSGKKPSEYDGTGRTVYNGGSVTYTESGSDCNVKAEYYAGGSSPELYIKGGEWWNIASIPTGGAATLTLTYMSNNDADVTTTTKNVAVGTTSSSGNSRSRTITISGDVSYFDLKFAKSSNTRVDNVLLKVASVSLTNYVTECDPNIVKVTYNANSGTTSCTNTTTDKTEDFTVCSTEPTRDYYTFAGWLCSADDEVYEASATIDDAVIDADFTLTAQWTPVPYSITYELDGGTNNVGNPATYNVTTATITLQDPTKGHDRFEGWYSTYSAGVYSDPVTEIPLGSHDNITLYAKWTERHEIVFDYTESASSGTTTIYRADDEDLSASVAGQGSVPSDPSAPSACSAKVFVGWSESTIDDETDDEPADLMKPAAGTVDEDKHYYAVWATGSSVPGPVTVFEDALYGKAANNTTFSTYGSWKSFGYVYGRGISTEGVRVSSGDYAGYLQLKAGLDGLASVDTIKFKIMKYGDETATITLSSYSGNGTYDDATSVTFTASSKSAWEEKTCILRDADATTDISFEGVAKNRIFLKDIKITKAGMVTKYTGYATSCCATKVTLSQNSPSNGTIEFGKTKVGTCGDKEVSLTITPAVGYQLHTYEVATGSGKVATKSVNPAISLDNNSSAAQNITLTFADEANGAYDVTASFSLMTVTSWTWTMHDGGGAIPDPLNLYVGQRARLDVAYTPSGVDASKKTYTRDKTSTYINWVGSLYSGYSTIEGRASTGENTTPVTFTHADGPETIVNVKVLPLPLTHFEDLVHGKAFADVEATLVDNALSATKTTPTSDDWTTPNANTCEENHLHLVGWIREDWPALVAYLNGTGDAPATTAIVGAGNDGSGNAYFFAPNASINVQTFDGVTFYAVWAEIK
ncbi:MAG: InlB B-repeat-containing protein [Paludibacteraceae bacterium]|nr:InlB B-repeat-containing protein [Paludibacteraceae bacterium]